MRLITRSKPTQDYQHFYDHYRPFVAAFVARRSELDAVEDLVAEVFTTAWRRRRDVPPDALPWLLRTARNVVGNHYRSTERFAALRIKLEAVPHESPADPGELATNRDHLATALSELGADDRELLLLVAWDGLSTQEAAVVLDLSPGTASVRLHRARQRLERRMASCETNDHKGDAV